jgi:hypothetical protein
MSRLGVSLNLVRALLAVVLTGLLLVAYPAIAAAAGLPPGVHIDPGSPTGKQYQIPISGARNQTSGSTNGSTSSNPPAFGAGVTPSGQTRATTTSSRATRSAAHTTAAGRRTRRTSRKWGAAAGPPATTQADRHTTTQANAVGSSSWLPLAGGGALVLLLGCGGGLALKRRM